MSREELIKQNQKLFKQNFKRNYKIYNEIMNSINGMLKLISIEKENIKNFADSQNRHENNAVVYITDIKHLKEQQRNLKVIELNDYDVEDYQIYVKARKQLDNIYSKKTSSLSLSKRKELKKNFDEVQKTLTGMSVTQLKHFEKYYDYSLKVKEMNKELFDLENKYKEANKQAKIYKDEVELLENINNKRKNEVIEEKFSRLNSYVEKIRKNYSKFSRFNKAINNKKIKRIQEDEKRMTF